MSGDDDFQSWAAEEIVRLRSNIHLRRPSDYQSLFKYVNLNSTVSWAYLQKTLHNAELIGAAATSLNDPFELHPYVFDDLRPGTIAKSVKHMDYFPILSDRPSLPLTEVFPDVEPFRQQARSY